MRTDHRIRFAIPLLVLSGLAAKAAEPVTAEPCSAAAATQGLLQRILPHCVERFVFEPIAADAGRDVFEIDAHDGKIVIRGNNGVAMAAGLNWYLKYHCHCHVSLGGSQLDVPEPLPTVASKIRRVSASRYRYFLNYCCFGYSLPWYNWQQWETLIDWMALNGVNAPLSVTGQEAVWQAVLRQLELSDQQIGEFLAGPPYLPFGWMGCLDGWGGPLPQNWIDRHVDLQQKILARQRQFGMTPVLQGFTGHVPAAIKERFPDATLHQINWIEWQTQLLDPLDPLYPRIARLFLEEQTKRFGSDHLYAADTFIEMTPPRGDAKFLSDLSRAIYDGMAATDPDAVWVLQGWTFMNQRTFWTQPRIDAFLNAIDNERMLVLDLFCESTPMWNRTEAFCGKPWVWCNIQNFGNTVFLGGALNRINHDLTAARRDPNRGHLTGIGFVNEGLGFNPVVFDLLFEMAWRSDPVDWDTWMADYSHRRGGRHHDAAAQSWRLLKDTVYSAPQGARSIIDRVPSLQPPPPLPYDNGRLVEAWRLLLAGADELGRSDAYQFDLVNVARQALSNHAAHLHRQMASAYEAKNLEEFNEARGRFVQLIRDLDELLGTRREFLLGRWLEDARQWGETPAQQARFEWNARRVLTLWGTGKEIRDYARKEWAGMLSGFYGKRWEMYLDQLADALAHGRPLDDKAFTGRLMQWEADWSDETDTCASAPSGDSLTVVRDLWAAYGDALSHGPQ